MSEVKFPLTLESYDPEITHTLQGEVRVNETTLCVDLADGRKVAIDFDERGLRVYGWTQGFDAPVTLAVRDRSIDVDIHDFVNEGGGVHVDE